MVQDIAKAGALLYAFGAVLLSLELWIIPAPAFPAHLMAVAILVVAAFAGGAGVFWLRPYSIPLACWPLFVAMPVGMILFMAVASNDPSASSQLAFCWPVFFGAYYLKRAAAQIVTALAVGAEITLCVLIDPNQVVVEDAVGVSVILCALMVTLIRARDRVDELMRVLRHDAETDAVTGLLSRRAFDADLQALDDDEVTALIVVDIDAFKQVNDSYGHAAGDDVLRVVATCLEANRRPDDTVYRLGGDEFAVLLPGCPASAAAGRGEEIRHRVEVAAVRAPATSGVTVSVGVACLPDHVRHHVELLAVADVAMYAAKNSGRNRVVEATQAA
ncbi:MAG: diguanylate cyclase [Acidothermaceae bacterium]